uniref:Alternative protein CDH20 n=1 Tax=Homo sapiens TaxID=9606 RepID=L8EAG9_HUMAN|nr:alternative protein CDH20 [Homo sapiens]
MSASFIQIWTGETDPSNTSSREKVLASCLPSTTPLETSTPFRGSTERKEPSIL